MVKVRQIEEIGKPCEVDGCDAISTAMAYSSKLQSVLICCEKNSEIIADEHYPEYIVCCQNCGCVIPVN